jgi:NAD(P)-dependent dehydrogenase (short-subunit alcohol dehydrogenase family)
MGRLDGKVAIVTGAGGGIGREHALLLAREGAKVVVNDTGLRTGADAAAVVKEIEQAGGTASANSTSATWDGAEDIVAATVDTYGRLDILVNNATAGATNDLWKFTEAQWDRTVGVNLKGYFAMIRAGAPHLCRQGSGVIVNTSSGSGFGHPAMIAYATAKEGVIGLTRTVAKELGRFGVRCNAIRPFATGVSTTEYSKSSGPWMRVMTLTMGPEPGVESRPNFDPAQFPASKISPFVVWLCTDAAANVNGRSFHVAGDDVGLLSEPAPEPVIHQAGGWDLNGLDATAPAELTVGLANPYTLDGFPELKVFED